MAKPLRPKRGTTAKNDAFTGLASEITIDTDKHSIRVHDGVTAGGHEILPSKLITSVENATNAVKATQDANGNVITSTYAKKTELSAVSTTASNAAAAAASAQTTANNALPKTGGTVSGSLTVTGTLKGATIQATSDARLKEDFAPITSAIDRLCKLDAFTYSFKNDKHHERHAGLIAQQVKDVLPEAVKEDEHGYLSIDYNGIIAMLVQAIREMNNQNKEH